VATEDSIVLRLTHRGIRPSVGEDRVSESVGTAFSDTQRNEKPVGYEKTITIPHVGVTEKPLRFSPYSLLCNYFLSGYDGNFLIIIVQLKTI
jgi:hypothetical protein